MLYLHSSTVLWSSYVVFADEIATLFCVNQTTLPECHGKCHIVKVEDHQQPFQGRIAPEMRAPEYAPLPELLTLQPTWHFVDPHRTLGQTEHPLRGYPSNVLRPPITV